MEIVQNNGQEEKCKNDHSDWSVQQEIDVFATDHVGKFNVGDHRLKNHAHSDLPNDPAELVTHFYVIYAPVILGCDWLGRHETIENSYTDWAQHNQNISLLELNIMSRFDFSNFLLTKFFIFFIPFFLIIFGHLLTLCVLVNFNLRHFWIFVF